jgi:Tol biopolymer transport system component
VRARRTALRLLAVAAAVVLFAVAPAAATDEPEPAAVGRIVFETGFGSSQDGIWIVDADGTRAQQLAATNYADDVLPVMRPALSPGGDRVVFVQTAFGSEGYPVSFLALVSARGRPLGSFGRGDFPSWSPDGRWIAFKRLNALHVIRSDGAALRRITRVERESFHRLVDSEVWVDEAPAWAPDGRRLAFARGGEIWSVRLDRREERRLTASRGTLDAGPSWSPDGRSIAWNCGRDVCAMRSDGSAKRRVASLGTARAAVARWSPDARRPRLAYLAIGPGLEPYSLYVTARGTSRPRLLLTYPRTNYPDFTWSPDGLFLAFPYPTEVDGHPPWDQQYPIAVLPVDGGRPRPVSTRTGWHPQWSG